MRKPSRPALRWHGGGLPAPDHYAGRARRNFDDGVLVGLERRERGQEKGIAYANE